MHYTGAKSAENPDAIPHNVASIKKVSYGFV
jgi:hypothetical protein